MAKYSIKCSRCGAPIQWNKTALNVSCEYCGQPVNQFKKEDSFTNKFDSLFKKIAFPSKEKIREKEAPQIIFIERCLEFLKEGGKLGIVLPDGIFGNDKLGYIREYLLEKTNIIAVIDVPFETFMPNTPTKTSILILRKKKSEDKDKVYPIFMAVAETCGHDRRAKFVDDDDIAKIAPKFKEWQLNNKIKL